ncbi:MAG: hypothetical protein SWX82_17950 [Cyanobacteriota bacterium]|nr:hypothetical protein [Cyanobacteriota bacterium]
MEKILRHQSREEKSYHPAKHLFFIEVATPKNFHPINSIDIIHVEAIAIFTFQSNYHPVKLQKTARYFLLHPRKNYDTI